MNGAYLFSDGPGREITLYDWQEEAVDQLRGNMRQKIMNQILCAPTGAGKTVIASHLIRECYRRGKGAVFVVDREALIEQTSDELDSYGVPHGVIQANHWRTAPYHRVQVATAQTLARRGWPECDLIVVDEAHTLYRDTIRRISRRDTYVIGLSATPFTRGLGRHYDRVVMVRTLNQLTREGYLAPFEAYAPAEPDMAGAKTKKGGEWSDREAERRCLPIIGDAVAEYLEKAPGKKFLCYGVTQKHCEELQKQFLAAGIQCALYTALTPIEERRLIRKEFAHPDSYLRGLISVAALSKGFDEPSVEVIIMCRPFRKAFAEHIQILGRGLRRDPANPDKKCIVLDLSGNMVRFWSRMMHFFEYGVTELNDGTPKSEPQRRERQEPDPVKCPKCACVHRPRRTCPNCGHEYPRRSGIEHLPGRLVALSTGSITTIEGLHQDIFAQLRWIQKERGYKPGWAAHKFEALFGPGTFREHFWLLQPKEPTEQTKNWVRSQLIRYAKSAKKAAAAGAAA